MEWLSVGTSYRGYSPDGDPRLPNVRTWTREREGGGGKAREIAVALKFSKQTEVTS